MPESLGSIYLAELDAEANATRACLERVPEGLFGWKPHDKSLPMGYLAQIVAEIPLWITVMCEEDSIDFVTFQHATIATPEELVRHFDENMVKARAALTAISDEAIGESFALKANGQAVGSTPKRVSISSSINHMVHHRGQLTVYLRLNGIPVPSIYGPSADERGF
jgi:uncharacterized damage-inducible protein DinB